MNVSLPEGTSFCDTGGRLIFLDLNRARYFALDAAAEDEFRRAATGERLSIENGSALSRLVNSGVLLDSATGSSLTRCPRLPLAESSLEEWPAPTPLGVLNACRHLTSALAATKLISLKLILARLSRRKAAADREEPLAHMLAETAAALRYSARIISPLDQCLPRSLALAHALLDRNIRSTLVIGVRLHPFSAHCWVQHGRTLLNDSIDETRNFTPILVI